MAMTRRSSLSHLSEPQKFGPGPGIRVRADPDQRDVVRSSSAAFDFEALLGAEHRDKLLGGGGNSLAGRKLAGSSGGSRASSARTKPLRFRTRMQGGRRPHRVFSPTRPPGRLLGFGGRAVAGNINAIRIFSLGTAITH